MHKKNKWYLFDQRKGYRQIRPPVGKYVVVRRHVDEDRESMPDGAAVGYRKNAAGDKSCPYFVIPGIGGTVTAWNDCLPDGFTPMELGRNVGIPDQRKLKLNQCQKKKQE